MKLTMTMRAAFAPWAKPYIGALMFAAPVLRRFPRLADRLIDRLIAQVARGLSVSCGLDEVR